MAKTPQWSFWAWLYGQYRAFVAGIVRIGPIPVHAGFIMDGNRRFADKIRIDRSSGHRHGFAKLLNILEWCLELGISHVSVFAFGADNFKRSKEEVADLMILAEEKLWQLLEEHEIVAKHRIHINVIGELHMLPPAVQRAARQVMKATKHYDNVTLNICLAYSSQMEMDQAQATLARKRTNGPRSQIALFHRLLYTKGQPPVDLMIRTSGETRLSDFLLWQCATAHLVFSRALWPEFSYLHLLQALVQYQQASPALKGVRQEWGKWVGPEPGIYAQKLVAEAGVEDEVRRAGDILSEVLGAGIEGNGQQEQDVISEGEDGEHRYRDSREGQGVSPSPFADADAASETVDESFPEGHDTADDRAAGRKRHERVPSISDTISAASNSLSSPAKAEASSQNAAENIDFTTAADSKTSSSSSSSQDPSETHAQSSSTSSPSPHSPTFVLAGMPAPSRSTNRQTSPHEGSESAIGDRSASSNDDSAWRASLRQSSLKAAMKQASSRSTFGLPADDDAAGLAMAGLSEQSPSTPRHSDEADTEQHGSLDTSLPAPRTPEKASPGSRTSPYADPEPLDVPEQQSVPHASPFSAPEIVAKDGSEHSTGTSAAGSQGGQPPTHPTRSALRTSSSHQPGPSTRKQQRFAPMQTVQSMPLRRQLSTISRSQSAADQKELEDEIVRSAFRPGVHALHPQGTHYEDCPCCVLQKRMPRHRVLQMPLSSSLADGPSHKLWHS